jgi:hypothetical protein
MTQEERSQREKELLQTPSEMSDELLAEKVQWCEASALYYENHEDSRLARVVRAVAAPYLAEIEARKQKAMRAGGQG